MNDAILLLKVEARKKSGWLAALLNLFLPGAGYIYCGRWILGIAAFVFAVIVVVVSVVSFGILAIPLAVMLFLLLVIDGFLCAGRHNKRVMLQEIAKEEAKNIQPGGSAPAEAQNAQSTMAAATILTAESPTSKKRIILWSVLGGVGAFVVVVVGVAGYLGYKKSKSKPPEAVATQAQTLPQQQAGIPKPTVEQSVAEVKQQDQGTLQEVVGHLQFGKLDSEIAIDGSDEGYTFISNTPEGDKLFQVCGTDHCVVKGYFTNDKQLLKLVDVKKIPSSEQSTLKENVSTAQLPQKASFDCKKAKSSSEILICNDPELSKLDNELAEIYRLAKSKTIDAIAFKEQTTAAWKWRESNCRDKECLLGWYAERKDALLKIGQFKP